MYKSARSFTKMCRTGFLVATLLAIVLAATLALADGGGNVMPATAKPHGYSLDDMTVKMAPFQTSGNNMAFYPKTPFQILYMAAFNPPVSFSCPDNKGVGILFQGTNSFMVTSGTPFFVPLWAADDSPPVLPPFPIHASMAGDYFFDPALVGARDTVVIVDGQTTTLDKDYVGYAYFADALPNSAHGIVLLGAFLTPMSVGTHTVTIKGTIAGDGVLTYWGAPCYAEDYSYLVKVVPGKSGK